MEMPESVAARKMSSNSTTIHDEAVAMSTNTGINTTKVAPLCSKKAGGGRS